MMHDAEIALVAAFFGAGGSVQHIPFGVSGLSPQPLMNSYRQWSFNRWARRYGCPLVPLDALEYLEAGRLSIAAAYTPSVWNAVSLLGQQAATQRAIGTMLLISETHVRRALEMLEVRDLVRRRSTRGAHGESLFVVVGERPPSWQLFIVASKESIAA